MLSFIYVFSMIDRQILVLLIEPIKRDLDITDTQVSLLTGFAFALLYTVLGVPMGRAADRWSRKWVIGVGLTVWSLMTIGCGLARSFAQLFVARMGVGVGEAALTPTAHAMIPDLFPPHRMARGMAAFTVAAPIGSGLALVIGGAVLTLAERWPSITVPLLGTMRGWQVVFLAVGVPSLLMLLPLLTVPEPSRRVRHAGRAPIAERPSVAQVARYLWSERWAYAPLFIGGSLLNLLAYGALAWTPSVLIRVHGWQASEAGYTIGLLVASVGVVASFAFAWATDRLRARGVLDAPLRMLIVAAGIGLAALVAVGLAPTGLVAAVAIGCYVVSVGGLSPLGPAAIQAIAPAHIRAQTAALWLLVVNVIGIGFGPTVIALATDYLFRDPAAVGRSLALVGAVALGLGAVSLWRGCRPFASAVDRLTVSPEPSAPRAES